MCRRWQSSWTIRYSTSGGDRNSAAQLRLMRRPAVQLPHRVRCRLMLTSTGRSPVSPARHSTCCGSIRRAAPTSHRRNRSRACASGPATTRHPPPSSLSTLRLAPGPAAGYSTRHRSRAAARSIRTGREISAAAPPLTTLRRVRSIQSWLAAINALTSAARVRDGTTTSACPWGNTRTDRRFARVLRRTDREPAAGSAANRSSCEGEAASLAGPLSRDDARPDPTGLAAQRGASHRSPLPAWITGRLPPESPVRSRAWRRVRGPRKPRRPGYSRARRRQAPGPGHASAPAPHR